MKATAAFKMKKETKRMLTRISDSTARGEFKRMMINAQLQSMIRPKKERRQHDGESE
jgi:hypothetical protein